MRLSVIVTCTQPWPEVRGCLARLLPQSRPGDMEVIVADDSRGGLDPPPAEQVTWLRRPGWGPHELRLLGLTEAGGDIVAITEDHCDVTHDWCERVLAAHAPRPDAAAILWAGDERRPRPPHRPGEFPPRARTEPSEHEERPDNWFPPAGSNASYKRGHLRARVQRPGDLELVVTPQL
jgi:Glycosyl transferase family 2